MHASVVEGKNVLLSHYAGKRDKIQGQARNDKKMEKRARRKAGKRVNIKIGGLRKLKPDTKTCRAFVLRSFFDFRDKYRRRKQIALVEIAARFVQGVKLFFCLDVFRYNA